MGRLITTTLLIQLAFYYQSVNGSADGKTIVEVKVDEKVFRGEDGASAEEGNATGEDPRTHTVHVENNEENVDILLKKTKQLIDKRNLLLKNFVNESRSLVSRPFREKFKKASEAEKLNMLEVESEKKLYMEISELDEEIKEYFGLFEKLEKAKKLDEQLKKKREELEKEEDEDEKRMMEEEIEALSKELEEMMNTPLEKKFLEMEMLMKKSSTQE